MYVNDLDVLLVDVDGNCTIAPGSNACFFANLSFSPQPGTKQDSGIISFLVGNYTLNKQRTNDPNVDVFFEICESEFDVKDKITFVDVERDVNNSIVIENLVKL